MSTVTIRTKPVQKATEPSADLAWLAQEKAELERPRFDPHGAREFASAAVWDVILSMKFYKAATAEAYLANPDVPESAADLERTRVPAGRRSPLARELDAIAADWLLLGETVATLAAYQVLVRAADVESLGSQSLDDYIVDEAVRNAHDEAALDIAFELDRIA